MTAADKKLLQETHDSIIELKTQFRTIIIGNGVTGLAEKVKGNSDFIAKIKDLPKIIDNHGIKIASQEKRFDKAYYKLIGGGVVAVAAAELIFKFIFRF